MAYQKFKSEAYQNFGGINSKVSPYGQGPTEFRDLLNLNFIEPGSLTKRPGTAQYSSATVAGQITGGVEFEKLDGSSYIIASANTNVYKVTPSSFTAFKTGVKSGAIFDFVTFVDRLFGCNGTDFFKYDGTNVYNFSLPPGFTNGWGVTTIASGGSLAAGTYYTGYGYINERGYIGPVSNGITIVINSGDSIFYYGLTTPVGYGITSLQFYRSNAGGVDLFGTTTAPANTTGFTDIGFPLSTLVFNNNTWFTSAPKFMELYNNQLMMAGFSSLLSTIFWSEVGDPEASEPNFNAEVRTNDGDIITGMKAYNNALVITKNRSFHKLSGEDPTNFLLQEVSDQYGCISNQAMVTYNNLLWFLDQKGVVEYNGSNFNIVSNRVEPFFLRMNISAAKQTATAIHYRQINEVWFSIPIDGATLNNITLAYDYVSNAWTRYDGFNAPILFQAKGSLGAKTTFMGGYSGNIFYSGQSLLNDSGNSITCMLDSRFMTAAGETTEEQYRRFFMNLNPVLGVTQPITINLKTNYSQTIQITRTMYQAPFQSRIDFGLSAKSIAVQMIHVSASLPLKINGYTFEARYQRSV